MPSRVLLAPSSQGISIHTFTRVIAVSPGGWQDRLVRLPSAAVVGHPQTGLPRIIMPYLSGPHPSVQPWRAPPRSGWRSSVVRLAIAVFSFAFALADAASAAGGRLGNLSVRGFVGTGENVLIPGFVVSGGGEIKLLIRAVGPGLAAFGVSGALAQPNLSVMNSSGTVIAANSAWSSAANANEVARAAADVGAFALPPGSADCAVLVSVPAGSYTASVSGHGNTGGIALAEVYEVSSTGARLSNISARSQVGTDGNILIAGFVIRGDSSASVLVRGIGPALEEFRVRNALARPEMTVTTGTGAVIATNSSWSSGSLPQLVANAASSVGAFPLASGSADCARLLTLRPGAYTVLLSGANNSTGVGLAEVYEASPAITLDPPAAGASRLSGRALNIDPATARVVIYVLTNQWYIQPFTVAPYTSIAADGTWTNSTHPWRNILVLLVNPAEYLPTATAITNPALEPGVLAWATYPSARIAVEFSGRRWGIKTTGNIDRFDPGPNYWSDDLSVVRVDDDGLHLKITNVAGRWQCGEVFLTESLGYGVYTVQVASRVDNLDRNTVAAPLFIYDAVTNRELDNEYSGRGGLIPAPSTAQFVVQPYSVSGNLTRYSHPSTAQFTSQIEWRADRVVFATWRGWANTPASPDMINRWIYTGRYNPTPGRERVRINLWLFNGRAPTTGVGDELIIRSFTFQR